jgi:hypothetical protein
MEGVNSTKGKNREIGLGRAPGVDLAAIYSTMRVGGALLENLGLGSTKKRKLKH